jgi:uncharacterized protein (DUF2336 family)
MGNSGVGLTAHDMGDMSRLALLAGNPDGTRREDIYLAVASLYRSQGSMLNERERTIMREIMLRLTLDVEMAIRITLAEHLADDPSAPLDLILLLCDDKIEVARPIILRSRRLSDQDLLKFIAEASTAHQTACAERPDIGEPLCDALARSDAEPVLVALVRNATARIATQTFETLVEKSRQIAGLQEPLVKRGDLPSTLATRMCEWVSEALKSHIAQSHPFAFETFAHSIGEAQQAVQSGQIAKPLQGGGAKLIDKLAAAGQLKAGFLLRVLHQGQMELFELAFAKMLEIAPSDIHRVLYESGARPVALACRAAGIDRCVFSTVFNLSRAAHRLPSRLTPNEKAEVESVFNGFSKAEALERIKSIEVFFTPAAHKTGAATG